MSEFILQASSGIICVGYTDDELRDIHYDKFPDAYADVSEDEDILINEFEPYEWAEGEEDLNQFLPSYSDDILVEQCIWGILIAQSEEDFYEEVDLAELSVKAKKIQVKLFNKYGIQPKVYVMAHAT